MKNLKKFIQEERRLRIGNRHSGDFQKGFVSACNIIETEIERTSWNRPCRTEGCFGLAKPLSDYCIPCHKERSKIWGEVDNQIERSTIRRYNWKGIFGHSLTEEILRLKKTGLNVEDTFTELLNNDRVIRFLDDNEVEAKNIVKNLKISVHARFGENNTTNKVMSDDDILEGIPT